MPKQTESAMRPVTPIAAPVGSPESSPVRCITPPPRYSLVMPIRSSVIPEGLTSSQVKDHFKEMLKSTEQFNLLPNQKPATPLVPAHSIYHLKALRTLLLDDSRMGHTHEYLDDCIIRPCASGESIVRYVVSADWMCKLGFVGSSKTGTCTHPWLNDMQLCHAAGDFIVRLDAGRAKIKAINNESGHYLSDFASLRAVLLVLSHNEECLDEQIRISYFCDGATVSVDFSKAEILELGRAIQRNFPSISIPEQLETIVSKGRHGGRRPQHSETSGLGIARGLFAGAGGDDPAVAQLWSYAAAADTTVTRSLLSMSFPPLAASGSAEGDTTHRAKRVCR